MVEELAIGVSTLPLPARFSTTPPVSPLSGAAIEAMPMYEGKSVRFVGSNESAAEIVREFGQGAEQFLSRATRHSQAEIELNTTKTPTGQRTPK